MTFFRLLFVTCLCLATGRGMAQDNASKTYSRAARENVMVKEIMDASALQQNIKDHISLRYTNYRIDKVFKRYAPNGDISYQVMLNNSTSNCNVIFSSDGAFIRESDSLSDMVRSLLLLALRDEK